MLSRKIIVSVLIASLAISLGAVQVLAAEGGYSHYTPGTYGDFAAAVAPPDGLTLRNDFYYYGADGGASRRSGLLQANADIEFKMDFLTLLHKPGVEVLGAQYAYGVFVPVAHIDIDANLQVGPFQINRQDDTFSLSDVALIPMMLFWNKGNFHFSLAEFIIAPTGEYDTDNLANAGLNYWTFDTNCTLTYLNETTGQDYSVNFGYNYNTENSKTDYKTGQEIHVDYMINQFFSESFALGVHGFYLKQVTGDSGSGATLGDFKAEAAGVGPAFLWITKIADKDVAFIAKWLHEYDAKKRFEGDHVYASFAFTF